MPSYDWDDDTESWVPAKRRVSNVGIFWIIVAVVVALLVFHSYHRHATARCEDGTLSYSHNHQGTCSHHGGVEQFYN